MAEPESEPLANAKDRTRPRRVLGLAVNAWKVAAALLAVIVGVFELLDHIDKRSATGDVESAASAVVEAGTASVPAVVSPLPALTQEPVTPTVAPDGADPAGQPEIDGAAPAPSAPAPAPAAAPPPPATPTPVVPTPAVAAPAPAPAAAPIPTPAPTIESAEPPAAPPAPVPPAMPDEDPVRLANVSAISAKAETYAETGSASLLVDGDYSTGWEALRRHLPHTLLLEPAVGAPPWWLDHLLVRNVAGGDGNTFPSVISIALQIDGAWVPLVTRVSLPKDTAPARFAVGPAYVQALRIEIEQAHGDRRTVTLGEVELFGYE